MQRRHSPCPARALRQAFDAFDEPAAQAILDRLVSDLSVTAVMRQIVLPYLAELGNRWERGDASIAQEHFASNLIRGGRPGWYAAGATGAARGPSWPARPGSGTTWP
jgi:MerR family transcriptional regulator, light-induced transcriptional regulator